MKLIIGNKRYSSWSLRPWVLMKHFGIMFDEVLVPLDQPSTHQEILKHSPSGKVPALHDGDITVWDSLAICEYLNEKYPEKQMWPKQRRERALARSISCEMHSGFAKMREILSHDLRKQLKGFDWSPAKQDIERIFEIWNQCLSESNGPFLFSEFSIADAMFAPVANRFISYGVPISGRVQAYVKTIRDLPAHKDWMAEAETEAIRMPRYE